MDNSSNNSANEEGTSSMSRFLSFSLAKEDYAVPLLSVKEVIAMPEITPIPYTPSHFLGIMNLRGQVISVIDLRTKFNIKPEASSETAVIICDLKPICLGVVVNSVNSVLSLLEKDINPRPEFQSSKASDYITGVTRKEEKLILLIDIARALDVADQTAMKQATGLKQAA
jgi:purine-binding chemotaxis protein CheW